MIAMNMKTMFGRAMKASLFVLILHVVIGMALLARAAGLFSVPARAGQQPISPVVLQFTSVGHALGFAQDGMYAAGPSHALHVQFVNANAVEPRADSSTGTRSGTPALSRVTYAGLWGGISLSYSPAGSGIYRTTWTLAPGADPGKIHLRYNALLTLNKDGSLSIAFETGLLTESAPVAWQDIRGGRVPVDVAFRVNGQALGFSLGAYDPRYALTIDPTVAWNTFLGGTGADTGNAIALDASGNIYIAGSSQGTWGNPLRPFAGGSDGFIARLNPSGELMWSTFLGGVNNDSLDGIAVDAAGNIFVTGDSGGPWGNPIRAFKGTVGAWDVLAARLDSSGNLVWNTFLGGTGNDNPGGIALDENANVYISGHSTVAWGSPLVPHHAGDDAFAARLGANGKLLWNTFLGGSGDDSAGGIALSADGTIFLTGSSDASWGSPVRAYSSGFDAFAASLSSSGSLSWNTFLGGSGYDDAQGIVPAGGGLYVVGSSDTKWGTPLRAYSADFDIFAARLNSSGSLTWNTFLGGFGYDYAYDSTLDANGKLYLAGYSEAAWGHPIRSYTDSSDGLVAGLNPDGTLIWNTFLGGSGGDSARSLALASGGTLFLAGSSQSAWGSPVGAHSGSYDGFAARLDPPVQFASRAAQDGWILESSETSGIGGTQNATGGSLVVGDDASNRQYRSILSFDTSSLPDAAIIASARLKIRASGLVGTNPFTTHGGLVIDIRKGAFSASSGLQLLDFKAAASKNAAGAFSKNPVGSWYTGALPATAYPYINTAGLTQFRLRFQLDDNNDLGADYIKFSSGNALSAYRPELIIEYYIP